MKTMKTLMMLMALTSLTACDYVQQRDLAKERAERQYRDAMADYQAGRLEQAVAGLKSVCGKDPANASARFQLACLLQDFSKDFFGAACAYAEYMAQQPNSDKVKLAKERFSACEREVAAMLADKYGLNSAAGQEKRVAELTRECERLTARNQKLSKDLEAAMRRVSSLSQETDRIKAAMASEASEETATANDSDIKDAKALLDEDEDSDAKPMIEQAPDAKEKREAAREAARIAAEEKAKAAAAREEPPDTYVVQEGDTLYKIAIKFYGRSSAWSMIRDANKATISTDGRVRTGQKILLPKAQK